MLFNECRQVKPKSLLIQINYKIILSGFFVYLPLLLLVSTSFEPVCESIKVCLKDAPFVHHYAPTSN